MQIDQTSYSLEQNELKNHIDDSSIRSASTLSNSTGEGTESQQKMITLSPVWKNALKEYKFIKLLGIGSYGEVVQAKHRATGTIVAIKLLKDIFRSVYESKKVIREVQILRQMTQMPGNQYTTKLYDLITPADEQDFSYLFIVQEYMQTDLKKVFSSMPQLTFTEDHMISILYNMLLAMNFIHSSNIMHRDIKPANILVDVDCSVKICDFGLGRTLPTPEEPRGRKSRTETAANLLNKREARINK